MAMTLEELQILITSETSGLKKELANVKRELNSVNKEVKSVTDRIKSAFKGVAAILSAIGIGATIRSATREAMQFEAAVQQLRRLMGSSVGVFQQWANEQAIAFGMARSEAMRYGAVFANLVSSFATNTAQVAQYTQDLLQASAVVASYTGRTMEDVMERIRSGLLGNTEAIEDLGINVNVAMIEATEAFRRFAGNRSWNQLDFRTQQTIRYFAILEQAAQKYGQEIAQNTTTRQAMFTAQLKEVQLALGQAFLPIYNTVLPALTNLAASLANVMRYVAAFMQALFGTNQSVAQQAASAAQAQAAVGNAIAKSGEQAEKAGKQAQGAVASFDEVHQVMDESAGTGAAAGGIAAGVTPDIQTALDGEQIDTDAIPSKVQEIADKVKGIFAGLREELQGFGQQLGVAFSGVIPALQPIADARGPIVAAFTEIGQTAQQLAETYIKPAADYLLFDFIPSIVTGFTESFAPVFADVLVWSWQEFAKTFQNVTATASDLLNTVWIPAAETIKAAFLDAFPTIAGAVQSVLDGTIKPFVDYVLNDFIIPIAAEMNRTFVPIFADTAAWAIREFAEGFQWGANLINEVYNSVIQPVFDLIKTIVLDTLQIVVNLWQEYGQTLLDNLSELFDNIRGTFQLLWDEILAPIIQPFLETMTWLWEMHLKNLVDQVGQFIMKLVNGALEIYNKFISPIVNWLIKTFGPVFVDTFNFVISIVSDAIAMIADVLAGLFEILGGVIDFIVGVFTGNWRKAWEGVRDIFKGIVDSLWGILKFPLNLIIDGINRLIDGLNSIRIDIPEWVPGFGGKSFGISIPKIPKLARGGIIDQPTLALVGESGKEAVVPLENTGFVNAIASAVGTAVLSAFQVASSGGQNSGAGGDIVIQIDGTTLARILSPLLEREQQRLGTAILQPI